jgi:tetratricopeptide (TPR) repeat protein
MARRFEEILKNNPAAYSFAPLADIYRSLGLVDDALATARKGTALHPEFAAGQMALAKAAMECSLKDEARKALETVVRVTPENSEAQRLLADIYTADGNEAAARYCLAVAASLAVELPAEPASAVHSLSMEEPEEELLEADILDLSDDQIEFEDEDADAVSPFAALPDRPSLGDTVRAEPYMLEVAPPFHKEEPPEEPAQATVASATIAELYVSQGFPEKGMAVYRELLAAEPANQGYSRRLAELEAPEAPSVESPRQSLAAAAIKPQVAESVLETLSGWLGNIGRVRECRTKSL